ncbi:12164_t:CDS:10 [Ambispora leptoticha]|uniref:Guanine nucleotide-binding protein-like 1 n=1 Tax=Ambispora leptoticha TaxID=144679 RepID=A0A9N8VSI9_9GLOM|nr:12164_t:CDS:10 [Ambispora leptoticha]
MSTKHRKKPFSGKQKRKQLQERRAKYIERNEEYDDDFGEKSSKKLLDDDEKDNEEDNNKIGKKNDPTKLYSVFKKLTPREVQANRLASMKPFTRLDVKSALEVSVKDIYTTIIEFPKRPPWNYQMNKEQLTANEEKYFQRWLKDVYDRWGKEELSFFEHNLEVWRQLWRVFEISDMILIIVDIRHPLLHFPPSLYNFVVKELGRDMILVFNKIDLVARNTVEAWSRYFQQEFPNVHIVGFSSFPVDKKFVNDTATTYLQQRVARLPRRRKLQNRGSIGKKDLLVACKDIKLVKKGVQVDWEGLIAQYEQQEHENGGCDGADDSQRKSDDSKAIVEIHESEVAPHKDYITIGLVGHPNVGKSSLINSIMRRTVVSASKTPGHTKHFQTIHLTGNIRLCDSPGLVFPSLLPKATQILFGMYPISQVQEPYSTIQYLAERIPLEKILRLTPPEADEKEYRWSAWDICEAFAMKRHFFTSKSSRPDVYRAANAILRMTNDGRILLSFKPPGFFASLPSSSTNRSLRSSQEVDDPSQTIYTKLQDLEIGHEEEEEKENDKNKVGGSFSLLMDESDVWFNSIFIEITRHESLI